ncbi:MAG: DUF1648 domain-containing protein [Lachnospiraceae bacterium]
MAKPYITKKHCAIEIISYVMLLASFIIAVVGMVVLPEEIATHFDGAGNVDGYGSPVVLIFLPIIMLLCNGVTSLILHLLPPDAWNTPCKIKPGQEIIVYRDMSSMLVWMEFEIAAFTVFDTIMTYLQSGKMILVGAIVFMVALTVTIIYEIVMIVRHSKR